MKYIVVFVLLFAAASAAPNVVNWFEMEPAKQPEHVHKNGPVDIKDPYEEFKNFKTVFSKIYKDFEEEKDKFDVFKANLEKIKQHNEEYKQGKHTYYLGVNQFADMKHEDFIKYNGLKKAKSTGTDCSSFLAANNLVLPETVDWRTKGYVTKVKNQGQCGSCWSFSTTGSLEGQHFKKYNKLVSLSEQQLVDCSTDYGNEGCNGGLMDQAFKYIKFAGGLESETEYPYEAKQEKQCHFIRSEVKATVTGCVDVNSGDEMALKKAVGSVGPVSVAIDASHQSFQLYSGGVYNEDKCSSTQLDHGVLVVGYGTDDTQNMEYWLVKNSWGENWGDQGYVKMARNHGNMCGIATQASYPLV